MTLFIISICLFVVSVVLLIICILADWNAWVFIALTILLLVSGLGFVLSPIYIKPDIKSIEYPASEYDFKIKVVEFEQQKDTILVVIPKEE